MAKVFSQDMMFAELSKRGMNETCLSWVMSLSWVELCEGKTKKEMQELNLFARDEWFIEKDGVK